MTSASEHRTTASRSPRPAGVPRSDVGGGYAPDRIRFARSRAAVSSTTTREARVTSGVAAALLAAILVAPAAAGPQARAPEPAREKSNGPSPLPVARVGPWIRGLVLDERGKPVAGARVSALWDDTATSVTTRADGTFVLPTDGPTPIGRSILATADGGASQGIYRLDASSGYRGPRSVVRVVLRPAHEVTVTVVDRSGTPVPDAGVLALDQYFPAAEARTNARGVATLRVPEEANMQWIAACKAGVGLDYFENDRGGRLTPWTRPPRRVHLVLDGVLTVRVRTVDPAGRPVPGVELSPAMIRKKGKVGAMIHHGGSLLRARTGTDGFATFDWLPAGFQGRTSILPVSSPSAPFLPEFPVLDPDQPQAVLTVRVWQPVRVSGRVTFPDGSPAPGILVRAENAIGPWRSIPARNRTRTGADGTYAMDLPPEQSYLLAVDDDEWAAPSLRGVVVRTGVPRAGLDFTLTRGGVIRGRVTARPDAKPVPGKMVRLVEQGPVVPPGVVANQPDDLMAEFNRLAETDEDGRYAFRVAPGTYRISGLYVSSEGVPDEELKVVAGQEVEWDFKLSREGPSWRAIRGVVRAGKPDGPPIAGAVVVAAPFEGGQTASGDADDRGRFAVPCLVGKALVYARSPRGDLAGYAAVDHDGDREPTIVVVPAATARGRVIDESGKPWASVNVTYGIYAVVAGEGAGRAACFQTVLTDDDGRFTAPGLPPGDRCYFSASAPGGANHPSRRIEVKDARPFEIPPLVIDRPRPPRTGAARP